MNVIIWMKTYFQGKVGILRLIICVLVIIAIVGILDRSAYSFIKSISEKNLGFLGLLAELNIILAGIGDFVPFLKGHTVAVNQSFAKAENYLLIVNAISLIQLMLLGVSKTWLFKGLMLTLFSLTFFNHSRFLAHKLLIVFLAVNPGLQVFSLGVEYVSKNSSIDYGAAYLDTFRETVSAVKAEKAQLMNEHTQHLQAIDKDKKGIVFLKKLKEDISYDVKKAKSSIKGDYEKLRVLVHDGGKEVLRKMYIFCTMVLFSLFILPLGYALLVYIVYRSSITPDVVKMLSNAVKKEVD